MSTAPAVGEVLGGHVAVNGIRQHFLRVGSGAPLLVVPGITSPAVTWAFVAEALAPYREVYVLDVRGRGLSSAGDLDYGLDACAADVTGFARAMGWDSYDLLGHSMGARIVLRAATAAPRAMRHLVLADPPLSGPGRRPYVKSLAFYLGPVEQARRGELTLEQTRAAYPRWTVRQHALRAEWLHTCDPLAIAGSHRSFHDEEVHGDLARLGVPATLFVAGQGDVIRPDELDEVCRLQPNLGVRHFPQAGHMIPFDDLAGFVRETLAVLA